jgi:hypothetical protein
MRLAGNSSTAVSRPGAAIATLALVSCGMVRWVFTARKRSVEFEVLYAPPTIRSWSGIGWPGRLVVHSAKIPEIAGSAMMGRLSEHRRGNGGGKNYYSTYFDFLGHVVSPLCSRETRLERSCIRNATLRKNVQFNRA